MYFNIKLYLKLLDNISFFHTVFIHHTSGGGGTNAQWRAAVLSLSTYVLGTSGRSVRKRLVETLNNNIMQSWETLFFFFLFSYKKEKKNVMFVRDNNTHAAAARLHETNQAKSYNRVWSVFTKPHIP